MKSIGSVLLSLTLIIFLTSCSSIKKIETFFTPVEREPLGLEEPVLGKLESIKWIVITSENAEEVFAKLEATANADVVEIGQSIETLLYGSDVT